MKPRLIAALLLGCVFLSAITLPVWSAPQQAATAYEVIAGVNALRASYGLDPYQVDGLLMISAQAQADYIASMYPQIVDGHTGPGGTDADARALAVGFPYVDGLDINENWASLPESASLETLIYEVWGDEIHMHTMLHDYGQLVGMGVASNDGTYFYVLDVAAYWGDAAFTQQPTTMAYGEDAATQQYVSQYIAPVTKARPQDDGSIIHTVMSGQSLWMLADHYDVGIDALRQLNGLGADDMLYIGQKILIRAASSETPTVSPAATQFVLEQTPSPVQSLSVTASLSATRDEITYKSTQDFTIWYFVFFALFVLGLVLVAVGSMQQ
jgi:LysM repeat protein